MADEPKNEPNKPSQQKNISRKATWSAAELDMERIDELMKDIMRLSYANRLYVPESIMPFFAALDGLYTILRCFVTEESRTDLDKLFKIMKLRIYTKNMRDEEGNIDMSLFDDLDKIYKDLYLIRQKAQLGIPYRKPMDLRAKLRAPLGLEEAFGEDNEDW